MLVAAGIAGSFELLLLLLVLRLPLLEVGGCRCEHFFFEKLFFRDT